VDTHGSGCTLSAAIAAHLARGEPLESAITHARFFLLRGLRRPLRLNGRAFIAHR
jgi:hydroxymethylpyrimidine/phosphomethylpyrimidine kinase